MFSNAHVTLFSKMTSSWTKTAAAFGVTGRWKANLIAKCRVIPAFFVGDVTRLGIIDFNIWRTFGECQSVNNKK